MREDSVTRPDGSVLTVKRDKLKLHREAVPTRFENLPAYLTKRLPPQRKDPSERKREFKNRNEESSSQQELLGQIGNFESLITNYKNKCDNIKNVYFHENEYQLNILKILLDKNNFSKVTLSLVVKKDLSFCVVKNDIIMSHEQINSTVFTKTKFDRWSYFLQVYDYLFKTDNNNAKNIEISQTDKLNYFNNLINSILDQET